MCSSLYMVLGMERMHFLAMNDFPVVVVTLVWVWWSRIDATGEDRWMLLAPTNWARPLAIDCAPARGQSLDEQVPSVVLMVNYHLGVSDVDLPWNRPNEWPEALYYTGSTQ